MPTIKLTAEGKIITKGGLPSCTCCGTTLYVEHIEYYLIYPDSVVSYFEMTGTVGAGFTGTGPGGKFTLVYDVVAGRWFMTDPVYGISSSLLITDTTDPAAPAGAYWDADVFTVRPYPDYVAYVSLTPLP
jgi:hypothetical protein